jgi:hypothetical protein
VALAVQRPATPPPRRSALADDLISGGGHHLDERRRRRAVHMVRNHVSLGQRRLPLRWLAGVLPENRLAPGRLVVPFYSSARTKGTTTHATTTEQAAADALFTTGHPAEPLLGSPVVRALLPHWRLQRNPDARKKGIDKDRDGELDVGGARPDVQTGEVC